MRAARRARTVRKCRRAPPRAERSTNSPARPAQTRCASCGEFVQPRELGRAETGAQTRIGIERTAQCAAQMSRDERFERLRGIDAFARTAPCEPARARRDVRDFFAQNVY